MPLIEVFTRADAGVRLRLAFLVSFMMLCMIAGGASRADDPMQLIVRLGAIALLALAAFDLGRRRMVLPPDLRVPMILFGLMALLVLVQLVPLPAGLHAALPGRALYVQALQTVGAGDHWHPLALVPDMALNSLLSLLPAIAVLAALAALPPEVRPALLSVLILGTLLSALYGLVQLSSGSAAVYLHKVTNLDFPVGFFANRNHQSLAMAMAIPLLAVWGSSAHGSRQWAQLGAAVLATVCLLPLILIAGSRAGFVLTMIVIVPSFAIFGWRRWRTLAGGLRGVWAPLQWLPVALLAGVAAVTVFASRATSVERLFSVDNAEDQRFANMGAMLRMIGDSFPVGFGFGSFDGVFRHYEPLATLDTTYFNHAHNDFIEVLIEGGLPAVLILLVMVSWVLWKSAGAWCGDRSDSSRTRAARLATILLAMIAAGSVFDYPLRTPFFSMYLAVLLGWLASARAPNAVRRTATGSAN